jgi:septal ring factor EnvC (AmiA/AmiB activator)
MKPLLFLFAFGTPLLAQQEAAENAKLREALRATAVQLRTAQADLANAQAFANASEAKNKDLEKKLSDSIARSAADLKRSEETQRANEKTIASLNNKVAERDKRISEYTEAIAKWKSALQQAAASAQANEAEKKRFAAEASSLKLTIADRERKNLALFNTAREILDRYEKHALGKAILAKEPFTQNTRVKIETLVQDYNGRILDNRISAGKP